MCETNGTMYTQKLGELIRSQVFEKITKFY